MSLAVSRTKVNHSSSLLLLLLLSQITNAIIQIIYSVVWLTNMRELNSMVNRYISSALQCRNIVSLHSLNLIRFSAIHWDTAEDIHPGVKTRQGQAQKVILWDGLIVFCIAILNQFNVTFTFFNSFKGMYQIQNLTQFLSNVGTAKMSKKLFCISKMY